MTLRNSWFLKYMQENDGEGNDLPGTDITAEAPAETTEEVDPDVAAFEELADSMLEDDIEPSFAEQLDDATPEAPAETAEVQEKTEETPNEEPKPEEESQTQETAEKKTDETTDQEETPVPETPSQEPTLTPEELQAQYTQQRTESITQASELFKLSDEDTELLRNEPEKVMPKLAAELFYDTHEAVVRSVMQLLPGLMQRYQSAQQVQQSNMNAFYEKWPALNDPKYTNDFNRISSMYGQLNPQASLEQFITEVGAQMMIANKIPFDLQTGQVIQPAAQEPAPTPAHRPAMPAAAASPGKAPAGEFEALAEEFIEDDRS